MHVKCDIARPGDTVLLMGSGPDLGDWSVSYTNRTHERHATCSPRHSEHAFAQQAHVRAFFGQCPQADLRRLPSA